MADEKLDDYYPFIFELFDPGTRKVVYRGEVEAPPNGAKIHVIYPPLLKHGYGFEPGVRMIFPNGETWEQI